MGKQALDHVLAAGPAAKEDQPLRHLIFNLLARPRDRVLLLVQGLGLPGDLCVLGGQLLVKALSCFLEEGSGPAIP